MGVEVVHDQVDCTSRGIASREAVDQTSELRARAIRRGPGEVSTRLGFHDTKDVRCAAPPVFVVPFGRPARLGRDRGAQFAMQRHRFLVQAYDRFTGIIGLLVQSQHVLHLADVLLVQLRHAPHFFPATASSRGFPVGRGSFHDPREARVCV